jgi:hypothetical protein
MSKLLPNSFQIPNIIVDKFIQMMNGSDLKIYLIIVRKTKGWNKEFDGISLSQFIEYSGISSHNTIRKSLKELVKLNLVKELKQEGKYSIFSLSDPYQNMTVSKIDNETNAPLSIFDSDPYQKLTIQKDTIQREEERGKVKLENFESFYTWLPKMKIKNEKWHKQKIKNNLLNDDNKTLENFRSFLDEQQTINSYEAIADIAKEQFELLKLFIATKTANEINELDKNKEYQKKFKEETNIFIAQKKGLVELSDSIENKNYHVGLLIELQKVYLNTPRNRRNIHEC